MNNLSSRSAWNQEKIGDFLFKTRIPVRISVIDGKYPLICSVWFEHQQGKLRIVSHKNSKLAKSLIKEGRCAFEIAANAPPYVGVRGKADVEPSKGNSEATLRRLIERYLRGTNQKLADWLLSRVEDEIEFTLHPTWTTSWDYGLRMETTDN